jgi:hypothetical protein
MFLRRLLLRSALSAVDRPGLDVSRFHTPLDGRRQTVALCLAGEMCDLHCVPVPMSGPGAELAESSA